MNWNEFGLLNNNRNKKRTLKVVYIQNGLSTAPGQRKASTATTSGSKSTERWHSATSGAGTSTETTTAEDGDVIVAITEGRGEASCEIGIAAMNIQHPELSLFQISDTSSYFKILHKIHILNPGEILVPKTLTGSRLVDALKRAFRAAKIIAIDRYVFRKENGQQFVRDVCAPAYNPVILVLQRKYYTLTAAGALQAYLETYKRQFYAKETLKVAYNESDYNAMIDVFVADKLELVACAASGVNANLSKKCSLRGILNHCITKLGSRMLRSTILQPPNRIEEINDRLNCVEELYNCPELRNSIRDSLKKLKNFGQVLSLTTILKANAQYWDERHLNYILLLNSFFDDIEPIRELLAPTRNKFFHQANATLGRDEFQHLRAELKRVIHDDAQPCAGEQARVARCFAVKAGLNGILDLLRTRYSTRVEEMRQHVEEVGRELGYHLKLMHNQKKGYHIMLTFAPKQRNQFKKNNLPPYICQVDVMATMVTMKTIKLLTLSNLLEDNAREITKISNTFLHDLLLEVHKHISIFYVLCEQIAKLDLLQALAHASASGVGYVRPKFDNFTKVIDGRHPLLDYVLDTAPVANNIIASPDKRLHLITGVNGSGKSIYIRQIVLLQVMAQIGCFVPATSATFRVCDRILARIYFEDNMECGASAFTLELKDVKHFLNTITDRTLIIIDELCRSTAAREGTALAMAICEKLLRTPAHIFFTTHYTYIMQLQQIYPDISCWQLETEEIYENARKPKLRFTHKLIPGVVTLENYGLSLARHLWPDDVTEACEAIVKEVDGMQPHVTAIDKKMALKINLESTLVELKRSGKCTKQALNDLWSKYQRSLADLGLQIRVEVFTRDNQIDILTQVEHVDMDLTISHGAILENNAPTSNDRGASSKSSGNLTETSYLVQNHLNRLKNTSGDIIGTSVSTNDTIQNKVSPERVKFPTGVARYPNNKITIQQNVIVRNPPRNTTLNSSKCSQTSKKGTFLFRNYSGVALDEQKMLQDRDDYAFLPIRSSPVRQDAGGSAFALFSQKVKEIQQQNSQNSQNIRNIPEDVKDLSNFDFETGLGNLSPERGKQLFSQDFPSNHEVGCNIFDDNDKGKSKNRSTFNFGNMPSTAGNEFSLNVFPQAYPHTIGSRTNIFENIGEDIFNMSDYRNPFEEREQENIFGNHSKEQPIDFIENNNPANDLLTNTANQNADREFNCFENLSPQLVELDDEFALTSKDQTDMESSLTSSRFVNNLRAENASTPVNLALPFPDNVTRMNYAQEVFASTNSSPSNDQFPTNLKPNVHTPFTDTTGTKRQANASTPVNLALPFPDNVTRMNYAQEAFASTSSSPSTDQFATNLKPNVHTPFTDTTGTNGQANTEKSCLLVKKKRKLLSSAELNEEAPPLMPFEMNFDQIPPTQQFDDTPGTSRAAGVSDVVFHPPTKAKPLNKMTKKELEQHYDKKRNQIVNSTNPAEMEKYYKEIISRPSFRQMQKSEVVFTARKTSDGSYVFDVPRKAKKFVPPFKLHDCGKDLRLDVTMFSDQNAQVYEAYLEYLRTCRRLNTEQMCFEEFKKIYRPESQ